MKSVLVFLILALALTACQQPAATDYGPRLDAIAGNATAAATAAAEAADLAQANAAALQTLQGTVQALAGSAQALSGVPGQVSALSDTLSRVDPSETGLLTVFFAPPLTVTATPGECPAGAPAATTVRWGDETRSIVFLGLPEGLVCVASVDPPGAVTVSVTAGQMLSLHYHVPTE